MTEAVVERRPGHCWRCGAPFAPGALIALVYAQYRPRLSDGTLGRFALPHWGCICPRCTTPDELTRLPARFACEGCNQPLAVPSDARREHWVCSNRCDQRARRRRQRAHRLLVVCDGCGETFRPERDDQQFCSNRCRQAAYRLRRTGAAPPRPKRIKLGAPDAVHLDDLAGVLHYQGTPIIAIDRLKPGWASFGNRYVMMFPHADQLIDSRAARKAGLTGYPDHLFECARCRRWSAGRTYAWCSRACRLAARAEQARERRIGRPGG